MCFIKNLLSKLRKKAKYLQREITTIYFAYKDPRTPWWAKTIILITLCYLLSPIDLIPDFIPILGYLDDLLIVSLLIALSLKLIPQQVLVISKAKAKESTFTLKKKWWMIMVFITIWIAVFWWLLARIGLL